MNMDTITSQPFLTTVSALLVIGLIRVLKQLASEKRHRLKELESLDEDEDDEYDPETELGIGSDNNGLHWKHMGQHSDSNLRSLSRFFI